MVACSAVVNGSSGSAHLPAGVVLLPKTVALFLIDLFYMHASAHLCDLNRFNVTQKQKGINVIPVCKANHFQSMCDSGRVRYVSFDTGGISEYI